LREIIHDYKSEFVPVLDGTEAKPADFQMQCSKIQRNLPEVEVGCCRGRVNGIGTFGFGNKTGSAILPDAGACDNPDRRPHKSIAAMPSAWL
jgi:hypothetical protein